MAALGLMSVTAMSAQAVNTTLESGVVTTTNLPANATLESAKATLDSEVLGGSIEVHCTTLATTGAVIKPGATGEAVLKFTGCETLLNHVASMVCLPKEPIESSVKLEGYLHNSEEYILVSPSNGTLKFTELKFDKEPGCSFGPNIEITGHAILQDCTKEGLVDKVKHLVEQIAGTTHDLEGHKNALKFGAKTMRLLGSAWIEMNTHNTWAFHT